MERYRRASVIGEELRSRYPDTRWSVRTVGYPPHVVIRWADGPTVDEVRMVAYEHEGRRTVRLERDGQEAELELEPGTTVLETPPATLEKALLAGWPVAAPLPYDDGTCGGCGGSLRWDRTAGQYRHATGSSVCGCARCGRPARHPAGEVLLCDACSSSSASRVT